MYINTQQVLTVAKGTIAGSSYPNANEALAWIQQNIEQAAAWLEEKWPLVSEWLTRPDVFSVLLAWIVTFFIVYLVLSAVGFNVVGVAAGSAAAWYQSVVYGAFTPAGGVFATLTSVAMIGLMSPIAAIIAGFIATFVAVLVWVGIGIRNFLL